MTYIVHLRRETDKVVRTFTEHLDWQAGSDYLWSEGNYSCDCNHALFFARAAEEGEPDDVVCGDKAFAARIVDLSGKELYRDEQWDLAA